MYVYNNNAADEETNIPHIRRNNNPSRWRNYHVLYSQNL